MNRYNELCHKLLNILYNPDLWPAKMFFQEDQRACIEVCQLTGLTPEMWDRLPIIDRIPWLESAVELADPAGKIRNGLADVDDENAAENHEAPLADTILQADATLHELPAKGRPGRRGYPLEALDYAQKLRAENQMMKAHSLRLECLKHFPETDLPPDAESFRRWLNRKRANRAN